MIFDDFVIESAVIWTQVCKSCTEELKLLNFLDEIPLEGLICGVLGCRNHAEYYLDMDYHEE
jgi:hypothetical protein